MAGGKSGRCCDIQFLQQICQLLDAFSAACLDKAAVTAPLFQFGVRKNGQVHHNDVCRTHLVEHPCACLCVFFGGPCAAQTINQDGVKRNLRLVELFQLLDRFGAGVTLFHLLQNAVTSAFQSDVQKTQSQSVQLFELFDRLVPQIFDGGVHRHTGAVGQIFFNLHQNLPHLLKRKAQRLASDEEHPLGVRIVPGCLLQIGNDLLERNQLKIDRFIHIAESTLVVGASAADLQQQRMSLKRRIIDDLIVPHKNSSLFLLV